jgi:hypothetical protein
VEPAGEHRKGAAEEGAGEQERGVLVVPEERADHRAVGVATPPPREEALRELVEGHQADRRCDPEAPLRRARVGLDDGESSA